MRIATLFFALLLGSLGFSQNAPIDFEPNGFGASFTWATFETPMGETDPTLTVVANPFVDATNGSANVAKFEVTYPSTANWGQAGCETMHGADVGTFVVTAANSHVRMQIYQVGFASPVAVKFATDQSAAFPETVVPNTVADAWVEVVFDMSQWIGSTLPGNLDQFIFFPSYAPRTGGHTVYFDNVEFISGNSVGIDDLGPGSFDLFPNPTQDSWTLSTDDVKISSIEVLDVTGKSVMSISLNNVSEATIDGSNLKAGLYFAQVTTPSGVHSVKLVKE